MSKHENTLDRVLCGTANANIDFGDFVALIRRLGFAERIKGSHHIYTKPGIDHILNIQPGNDGKAKPYQVRQLRMIIEKQGLKLP